MEQKNCISALIAEKTIEALYGKVSYKSSYDEDDDLTVECEWNFSSFSNHIKEREEILQNLDRDTVKEELQIRYDAFWYSSDRYNISDIELDEIVMWAKNGFITYH